MSNAIGIWLLRSSLAVVVLAITGTIHAEKDTGKVALPSAAVDAIVTAFPKARVGAVKIEEECGLKMYEVSLTDGATKMEVSVSEDGVIAEVGTKGTVADLPKAAADAIAKAAPGAEIKQLRKEEIRAEPRLAKLDTTKVGYELQVAKDGKSGEVKFAADGTVVEKLRWKEAKAQRGKEGEEKQEHAAAAVTLPEKASAALKAAFPKATIGAVKVETTDGTEVFEAILKDGDTTMEVEVTKGGLIVEVEAPIAVKDLPKAVADAVAKVVEDADIRKVQRQEIRAWARLAKVEPPKVVFEAELAKDGKEGEIKVSADGTGVEPVKWEADDENENARIELPAAVTKAFKDAFPKGKIEKLDVDQENGVTVYDIEFRNGPAEQETDIAADGTILEVTLVVDAKAVPEAAMKAIEKAAEGAKIKRIENIDIRYETKDGKAVKLPQPVTHFAAEFAKDHKITEVVVTPDGTRVKE